jgi:hypothetical protein
VLHADRPRTARALCLTLHYTGCRVFEALVLIPKRVDMSGKVIVLETLKKRRSRVYRAVPVPRNVHSAMSDPFRASCLPGQRAPGVVGILHAFPSRDCWPSCGPRAVAGAFSVLS